MFFASLPSSSVTMVFGLPLVFFVVLVVLVLVLLLAAVVVLYDAHQDRRRQALAVALTRKAQWERQPGDKFTPLI